MLEKLSDNIRECYQHAEDCQRRAAMEADPILRQDYLDMALRWRTLAHSYEFTERLADFTDESDRKRAKLRGDKPQG
jgi:hypothetical protein